MHCHAKRARLAGEDLAALAGQYRALSWQELERYKELGASATSAHRGGEGSFPVCSARAGRKRNGGDKGPPEARSPLDTMGTPAAKAFQETVMMGQVPPPIHIPDNVQVSDQSRGHDVVEVAVCRPLARSFREEARVITVQQEAEKREFLTQAKLDADAAMKSKRALDSMRTCVWHKHVEPNLTSFVACFEPDCVLKRIEKESSVRLAKQWEERHAAVLHKSWTGPPIRGKATTRCQDVGMCVCTAAGRIVHAKFTSLRRSLRAIPDLDADMANGHILLQFQAADTLPDAPTEQLLAFVCLHYLRPWLPTLAVFDVRTDQQPQPVPHLAGSVTEEMCQHEWEFEVRKSEVTANSPDYAIFTCLELLKILGAARPFRVHVWRTSTSPKMCKDLGGRLWARPLLLPTLSLVAPVRQRRAREAPPAQDNSENPAEEADGSDLDDEHANDASDNENAEPEADDGGALLQAALDVIAKEVAREAISEGRRDGNASGSGRLPQESSSSSSSSSSTTTTDEDNDAGQRPQQASASAEAASSEPAQRPGAAGARERARGAGDGLDLRLSPTSAVLGTLRINHSLGNIYCTCSRHGGCVKTRTFHASQRKGSGKPLGFLSAWGLAAEQFESKADHMAYRPDYASRKRGRAAARRHPFCEPFFALEEGEGCSDDSGAEPRTVPRG